MQFSRGRFVSGAEHLVIAARIVVWLWLRRVWVPELTWWTESLSWEGVGDRFVSEGLVESKSEQGKKPRLVESATCSLKRKSRLTRPRPDGFSIEGAV